MYKGGGGGEGVFATHPKGFSEFFLEDKTSAPDVFQLFVHPSRKFWGEFSDG